MPKRTLRVLDGGRPVLLFALLHACVAEVPSRSTEGPAASGLPALQSSCEKAARDPSCFKGPFSCADCCDTEFAGPGGNSKCWGGGYTYERCCPACPQAHDPSCFPEASLWTCEACCDTGRGKRGNAACWGQNRSFARCCLGRAPICSPPAPLASAGSAARKQGGGLALQTSQYGQDRFVLNWLDCPQDGFYLDLGAYDGEHLSNTHALDVDLGWRGICVDAVLRMEHFLPRSCRLVQAALHRKTGREMHFQHYPGHHESAYGRFAVGGEIREGAEWDGGVDPVLGIWEGQPMMTLSVADLLRGVEAEGFRVPRVIDYVSLDLEGTVPAVLEGFPFDRFCVRVWTLEVWTPESEPEGRQDLLKVAGQMQDNGYLLVQVLGADHVFVHRRDCK